MVIDGTRSRRSVPQLTVCLTRRMSLAKWDQLGTLGRELAIYGALAERGIRINVVSYGGPEEQRYRDAIAGLNICCNRWRLPRRVYEHLIGTLHRTALQQSTWIKTNQANGGRLTSGWARQFRKPLIARMGYLWSDTEGRSHGPQSRQARQAAAEERHLWLQADRIVVTTQAMSQQVASRLSVPQQSRIRIVPNFVDVDQFTIRNYQRLNNVPYDLVYLGRMHDEKNVDWILRGAASHAWRLLLIGQAANPTAWREHVGRFGKQVEWLPCVRHEEVPKYLKMARAMVLPSRGEGHPKAVLEAMACGIPVVATRVPGLDNLLEHRRTGYLCEYDEVSFRKAIADLLANEALQRHLSQQGAELVRREFSLETVATQEMLVLQELLNLRETLHGKQVPTFDFHPATGPERYALSAHGAKEHPKTDSNGLAISHRR